MIAISRYGRENGIVMTSVEGLKCLWASTCLGMTRSPDRLINGNLNRAFVKDENAGKELQGKIFAIGNDEKIHSGVMTAPLDLFPGEPDVVVLYLTAGRSRGVREASSNFGGNYLFLIAK